MPQVEIFQWNIPQLQNWMLEKWETAGDFYSFTAVAGAVRDLDSNLVAWFNALPDDIKVNIFDGFSKDFAAHLQRLTTIVMIVNATRDAGLPFNNPLNGVAFNAMFTGQRPNLESHSYILDTNTGMYYFAPETLAAAGVNVDEYGGLFPGFGAEDWARAQPGMAEWVTAFTLANRAAMVGASPEDWLADLGGLLHGHFTMVWETIPEEGRAAVADLWTVWSDAAQDIVDATADGLDGLATGATGFGNWIAEKAGSAVLAILGVAAVVGGIVLLSRR